MGRSPIPFSPLFVALHWFYTPMTFATAPAAWRYLPRSFAPHLCLHSATKEKPFSKLWVGIIIALRICALRDDA